MDAITIKIIKHLLGFLGASALIAWDIIMTVQMYQKGHWFIAFIELALALFVTATFLLDLISMGAERGTLTVLANIVKQQEDEED